MKDEKVVIYQIFTRLFGNINKKLKINGNRNDNGAGKFNDITSLALQKIKDLGITHVWYTGIIEHAIVEGYPEFNIDNGNPLIIKGKAGSPYAIKDYYDVNPDLAVDVENRMEEFHNLIERTHAENMKVIIDFVPNHLAREYHSDMAPEGIEDFGTLDDKTKSFDPNNNFYYLINEELLIPDELSARYPGFKYAENPAQVTGNNHFSPNPGINDWYETVKLNYGIDFQQNEEKNFTPIPDTWIKMEQVLDYWAGKGIDGFRCDMAEMVPVEFWNWVIYKIKSKYPGILFIAEIYDPSMYSSYIQFGNFDYLYDKVGLYDTLRGVIEGNKNASEITNCWQALNGSDPFMLRFLENHDEQRIASKFFSENPWKAMPAMVLSATMNKGAVIIYFGQEVGESALGESGFSGDDGRTTIFDYWNVPEHQKWMNNGKFDGGLLTENQKLLRSYYMELLNLVNKNEAITSGKFYDLMWCNTDNPDYDSGKIYSYLRYTTKQCILFILNFSPEKQQISFKIPEIALNETGLSEKEAYKFTELISTNVTNMKLPKDNILNGIKLQLNSFESKILSIH